MITVGNLKIIIASILIIGAIWFYKDWERKGYEAERLSENNNQERKLDSIKIAHYIYDKKQMENYVLDNKDLRKLLKENNIRLTRLRTIFSTSLFYKDTTLVETDLSEVLLAINKKETISKPFIDTVGCITTKGFIEYKENTLSIRFTERTFENETNAFGFWERNQWKIPILGTKTRFLGKRIMTAKVIDRCGETRTILIEKAK